MIWFSLTSSPSYPSLMNSETVPKFPYFSWQYSYLHWFYKNLPLFKPGYKWTHCATKALHELSIFKKESHLIRYDKIRLRNKVALTSAVWSKCLRSPLSELSCYLTYREGSQSKCDKKFTFHKARDLSKFEGPWKKMIFLKFISTTGKSGGESFLAFVS